MCIFRCVEAHSASTCATTTPLTRHHHDNQSTPPPPPPPPPPPAPPARWRSSSWATWSTSTARWRRCGLWARRGSRTATGWASSSTRPWARTTAPCRTWPTFAAASGAACLCARQCHDSSIARLRPARRLPAQPGQRRACGRLATRSHPTALPHRHRRRPRRPPRHRQHHQHPSRWAPRAGP